MSRGTVSLVGWLAVVSLVMLIVVSYALELVNPSDNNLFDLLWQTFVKTISTWQAVLLPADFEEYRRLSRAFKAAVAEMAPDIEDRGIDEIYIELTHLPRVRDAVGHDPLGGARALVDSILAIASREIRWRVRRQRGLPAQQRPQCHAAVHEIGRAHV